MTKKIYKTVIAMLFAGVFLFLVQPLHAFTSLPATDAYDALSLDPTAVMFDTRTVDEHNHQRQPWLTSEPTLDTTPPAGTAIWAVGGIEKLPITVPYWSVGLNRVAPGPPENEVEIRNIIEGLLSAGVIDFDTPIYLICRTAYRSYYMAEWMDTQTFTNAATDVTGSFTNLINIDSDGIPDNGSGGMKEWNAEGLPVYNGTIVPPQVFSGYPEDGYLETQTGNVIFAVGVLEPTTGGFVPPAVTDVSLYIDSDAPVAMAPVDEATLRLLFGIPADVYIPGTVYTATQSLSNGSYVWNASATNSAGTGWNLHVLDATVEGPDGPGVRNLTVDVTVTCTDNSECDPDSFCDKPVGSCEDSGVCEVKPDLCIALYAPVCGCDGVTYGNDCEAAAQGVPVAYEGECETACVPTPEVCDGIDNDCDGLVDEDIAPVTTTCGIGECASTGEITCVDGALVDSCTPGLPNLEGPPDDPTCSDNLDNDCDGVTDYFDSDCLASCTDGDGDGFAVEGGDCGAVDCNDNDATVYPGADDSQCDGIDSDCDGTADNGFVGTDTTCGVGECAATGVTTCTDGIIGDSCTPGTPSDEICDDGLDNDCDGLTDGSDPDCVVVACTDNDGDGYFVEGGDCGAVDCDDSDSSVNPGATEGPSGDPTCSDAKDNDCDGRIDNYDWDCYDGGHRMRRGRRGGGHGGRRG